MIRDKKAGLELTKTNFGLFSWYSFVYLALAVAVLLIALEVLR